MRSFANENVRGTSLGEPKGLRRQAHDLYNLAERVRQTQPRAARHLEQAADILLQAGRHDDAPVATSARARRP